MTEVLVEIPFDGFYCSRLDRAMDDTLEAHELDVDDVHWRVVHQQVARAWVVRAQEVLDDLCRDNDVDPVQIEFVELIFPREYNFETDRIIVKMRGGEFVEDMVTPCPQLRTAIMERHASRSGFISFHSNDPEKYLGKAVWTWPLPVMTTAFLSHLGELLGSDWSEVEQEFCDMVFCTSIEEDVANIVSENIIHD